MQHHNFPEDGLAKPPYSYAALICLAMALTREKMTLNQIYQWIREQFAFYRNGDQSWQVSQYLPYKLGSGIWHIEANQGNFFYTVLYWFYS